MSVSATALRNWTGRAALIPHIALDEAVLAVIRNRQPETPSQEVADRTAAEMTEAAALFKARGWLATPAAYHRPPPTLTDADLGGRQTFSWPHHHETVTFSSGFRPRGCEPGAERWAGNGRNDTVLVRLLRHPGEKAPWVVCLHGFGMGASRIDMTVLWATHLHRRFGFNVAIPVLPFHGPRRTPGDDHLLSMDLALTLHGISQAIWDIRRLVGWIRDTSGAPVGVYGLSLGGYLAALLAGIEPLDCVVAGIPFADVPGLMAHHGPPPTHLDTLRSQAAHDVFRVASPLAAPPLLAPQRHVIVAARGDRLIPAEQSMALQHARSSCPLMWCNGGHVGFVWSRAARDFVGDQFRNALSPGTERADPSPPWPAIRNVRK